MKRLVLVFLTLATVLMLGCEFHIYDQSRAGNDFANFGASVIFRANTSTFSYRNASGCPVIEIGGL